MAELVEVYRNTLRQLEKRHEELTQVRSTYDKRVALLEEEMDEIHEVICMMRPYLEET